jgi:hypothetical protein
MEAVTDKTHRRVRTTVQVIVAVALVIGVAGAALVVWRAEGRGKEDVSRLAFQQKQNEATRAKSLLPLVALLGTKRDELSNLQIGTGAYQTTQAQVAELQNLIGAQIPWLVMSAGKNGDLQLPGTADINKLLNKVIADFDKVNQQ